MTHHYCNLYFSIHIFSPLIARLGRNGIEEIKAHDWLRSVNFDTLRSQPVPYVPCGSAQIRALLDQVRNQDPSIPVSKELIAQITSNFDKFSEGDTVWGGNKDLAGIGGCMQQASPTAADRQEFIGYTFKRRKEVKRAGVGAFSFDAPSDNVI